jgi:CheY-like chemotaxis protein
MTKQRILLIDDEKSFTQMLKLNLEMSGFYEVREENRGVYALAAAREFEPDLIFLDIMMPDIEGDEVAAQLKADPRLKESSIVFLTAVASKQEVENHNGFIGGHSFLAKPTSTGEIIQCIRKHLGEPPSLSELTDPPGSLSHLYETSKGLNGTQTSHSTKSGEAVPRRFLLPALLVALILGGYFGYELYSRPQRLLRQTLAELKKTIQEHKANVIKSQSRLQQGAALETASHKAAQLGATQVSYSTERQSPGSLLGELASSVVKIRCKADAGSKHIRRGSGILYRGRPDPSGSGEYYVQTSLHVVNTTDGTNPQCEIFLYPDHTKGNVYLTFKGQGYKFYRKDIDFAILEPEIIKDDVNAGSAKDLEDFARNEGKNPLCDSAKIGDHLSVLGYPAIGGETLTVTEGIISGFEFQGETRFIKSSAKLDHGNSGGVAIMDSGCIVGITTFVQRGQLESMGRILDLNHLYNVILN